MGVMLQGSDGVAAAVSSAVIGYQRTNIPKVVSAGKLMIGSFKELASKVQRNI